MLNNVIWSSLYLVSSDQTSHPSPLPAVLDNIYTKAVGATLTKELVEEMKYILPKAMS